MADPRPVHVVETLLPADDLRRVPAAAHRAEHLGYDVLVTAETNRDPFLPLAVAATHTERIELATSVAIAFPRTPMVVAEMAWDLQRASGGRFVLGLGTQVRKHNEERFSVPWGRPRARLREYILTLRAIWRSWQERTRPAFQGEFYRYTYMTPFFDPGPIPHPHIPIHIAAVNPGMCRLAGELCDGARLHGFCTRRYLDEVILPNLAAGARRAGRDPGRVELSGGGFVVTGRDDAAVARQFELVRQQLAFYGSTPAYFPVLDLHGWRDLGEKLNRLSREGKWEAMARAVPDEVVHAFAAVGRYDEIVPRIHARFRGIRRLLFPVAPTDTAEAALVQDLLADLRGGPADTARG